MTLSLDDVRNKRFRLARKSGYEVAEVDDFLDQLQESFAQLIEENENLKKQIDALGDEASDAGRSDRRRPPTRNGRACRRRRSARAGRAGDRRGDDQQRSQRGRGPAGPAVHRARRAAGGRGRRRGGAYPGGGRRRPRRS